MKILGIDPGTANTGWGVIEMKNNSYHFVGCGVIRPSVDVLSQKYGYIYDELCTLIQTYDPSHISIESQFVYKNPQSALKLGMAKGMAILAGVKNGLSIFEYTPLKAKQAVTGHGNASKEAVEKMIRILLAISDKIPADAADALSLAICHAHYANSPFAKKL